MDPKRLYVRCKGCKSRFVANTTAQAWQNVAMMGYGLDSIAELAAHSCAFTVKYAGHPLSVVLRSCLRVETLNWKRRPNGAVTKCGSACLSAKGPDCDCACKGAHHGGRGFAPVALSLFAEA